MTTDRVTNHTYEGAGGPCRGRGERPLMARYNDDLYAEHASPESIQAQLKKTRAEGRRIERRIAWLEALLERRTAEREAGTWPVTEGSNGQ